MRWSCASLWLGFYSSICVSIHDVPLEGRRSKCSRTPSSDWCLSLTNDLHVTYVDLHRHLHLLGAGSIEDVHKGFGFVRYNTHVEATLAIQMGDARIVLFLVF